jgi:hypothetical protein
VNLVHTSLLFADGVAVTLNFREGEIEIRNDTVDKPTSYMEADLEKLA